MLLSAGGHAAFVILIALICGVVCCAVQADLKAQIKLPIVDGGPVDAFCGYFDVTFGGSEQNTAGTWRQLNSISCLQLASAYSTTQCALSSSTKQQTNSYWRCA